MCDSVKALQVKICLEGGVETDHQRAAIDDFARCADEAATKQQRQRRVRLPPVPILEDCMLLCTLLIALMPLAMSPSTRRRVMERRECMV